MARLQRGRSNSPTITDVARQAGVSAMTVSRVLNGGVGVREATREAVRLAMTDMGYVPNPAARTLAGAARLRIGLLYANSSAGFVGEFLTGSLAEATRRDVQLVFERSDTDDRDVDAAARLIEDGVDCVVLTPPLCEDAGVLGVFAAAGVPMALLMTPEHPAGAISVTINDRSAAAAMTRHLIALGHDRIGFIRGIARLSASAHRLAGYRDALTAAGLPMADELVAEGAFTYRSGLDAAERLLDLPSRPSAIFASNDDMAAAAVAVAHRRGLDVPGDLTVVGFDDTALATAIWPELTTIRQPIAEMSRIAIGLLVDRLSGGSNEADPATSVADFELVRRQSDAAPRRRRARP